MFNEWYRTAEDIKMEFEKYGEFENLKNKLTEDGIIFEGECNGLITSQLIEHGRNALGKLFLNGEDNHYISNTDEHLGWNYYLYDEEILSSKDAYNKAEKFFQEYLE